jgi:hypothetical protein
LIVMSQDYSFKDQLRQKKFTLGSDVDNNTVEIEATDDGVVFRIYNENGNVLAQACVENPKNADPIRDALESLGRWLLKAADV